MSRVTYDLKATGLKLFKEWQFPGEANSVGKLTGEYDIEPTRISTIQGGIENQTFLIECHDAKYVLRVYRRHKKTTPEIESELDFMQFLAERGVAVPTVVRNCRGDQVTETTVDGAHWQCIVMNYMPGVSPRSISQSLVGELARLQAKIHLLGIEYSALRGTLRHTHNRSWYKVSTRLRDSGLKRGYAHFDITRSNILTQKGHITALLDFDDMGYGPVVDCLARSLVTSAAIASTKADRAYYVSQYQTVRKLSLLEKLRIRAFMRFGQRIWPSEPNLEVTKPAHGLYSPVA